MNRLIKKVNDLVFNRRQKKLLERVQIFKQQELETPPFSKPFKPIRAILNGEEVIIETYSQLKDILNS